MYPAGCLRSGLDIGSAGLVAITPVYDDYAVHEYPSLEDEAYPLAQRDAQERHQRQSIRQHDLHAISYHVRSHKVLADILS